MDKQLRDQWAEGFIKGMQQAVVHVPDVLLKYYHKLQLNELDAMILIHCIAFKEQDNKDFPTHEELQSRLSAEPAMVIERIRKLVNDKVITIDERLDPTTGIRYERYNLDGVVRRLVMFALEEQADRKDDQIEVGAETEAGFRSMVDTEDRRNKVKQSDDVFTVFEKEFGRPLSPMECESISGWLDKDKYDTELILAALKEAVFSGKVHFRYIDRILLEWNRNRVFTLEQAKEYTKRFRGNR